MAYSIEEEDKMLAMIEAIANQPIEQQRPYNEVKNPKPIVESACFEGVKVDFSGWTEDKKKVGKAKTASNPDLAKQSKKAPKVTDVDTKGTAVATKGAEKPVTENDTVTEKKEDKQVTKLVTEDASHEAKGEPKAKTGAFDSKAKSTASAQRSKADSNKKFSEESKRQRKIDMFRDFVKSLGVDKESKEAAEKVLKKFDQISKHIGEPGDGKVKPKLEGVMCSELTESVNLMEAADGSTTVYTYGGNKKLSVTDGKISGIEGSQSLAKCNGFPIKVLAGDKGGELKAEIQVNGKWLRWNSHAPINDVSTGSSESGANEGKESNGSTETAGPVKNCGIAFRGHPEYKGNTMAHVAEEAIQAYCDKSGQKFPDKQAWASFTDEAHMANGVIILFKGPESFADSVVDFVKSNEKLRRILGESRAFTMSDKVYASYCDRGYPIAQHLKRG